MKGLRLHMALLYAMLLACVSSASAGDNTCKGYTSTNNPFLCYTYGNCVWWAAYKRPDLKSVMRRSAKYWYDDAVAAGFAVGSEPAKGSVVVFPSLSSNGHVAYVESVNSNGSFNASEMDFTGSFGDGMVTSTYNPASGGYKRNSGSTTYAVSGFIYPNCDNPAAGGCAINKLKNGNVGWFPAISDCTKASQVFLLSTENGVTVTVGSATKASCPLACVPPN